MRFSAPIAVLASLALSGCVSIRVESHVGEANQSRSPAEKLVIAHRGASGYLPEHTLAAKAMAYAQGAHYIEQDLVMTADDELIVLHDIHLDTVTNVNEVFPERARDDGRYYAVDFTLEEIRRLSVFERFTRSQGKDSPVYADRYPGGSTFHVHTFAEEIELIHGLNDSTGRQVGIYPEIKDPAFHREAGKDIASATLTVLREYGYTSAADLVFLQCFDPYELQRIHSELFPEFDMSVRLIQLIAPVEVQRPLLTDEGLAFIASFAAGIGPSMHLIVNRSSSANEPEVYDLVSRAHALGLKVHPYTFRRDAGQIPDYATDFNDLLRIFLDDVGVDGVFTDFPDLAVEYLNSRRDANGTN